MSSMVTDQASALHSHVPGALEDSAFQPDANFMFASGATDDEFHDLQQSLSSLGDSAVSGLPGFPGMGSASNMSDDPADAGTMNPSQSLFTNDFTFDQRPFALNPDRSMPPPSQQQRIVAQSDNVTQEFGQLTPPNDIQASGMNPSALSSASAHDASNAKSERARNAANQRHARKKKTGGDNIRSPDSGSHGEEQEPDKREKYREKNRLAAAKCRAKKKVNTQDLEATAREIQSRNKELKEIELSLRDDLSYLRNVALGHLAGGCRNEQLLMYNRMKAEEAAKSAQMGFTMPSRSPSSEGMGSMAPSPVDGQAKARPFSTQSFGAQSSLGRSSLSDAASHRTDSVSSMPSGYDFTKPTTQQALAAMYNPVAAEAGFPEYMRVEQEGQLDAIDPQL